jgi:hypothetical protein
MKYLFQSNKVSSYQLGEYLASQGYLVKSIRRFSVSEKRYAKFIFSDQTSEVNVIPGYDVFVVNTSAPETALWAAFLLIHVPGDNHIPPETVGDRWDWVPTSSLIKTLGLREKTHDRYCSGHM